jgi:hypothetical protein
MSTTSDTLRSQSRTGPRSIEARDYESTPTLLRRLVNDVGMLFAQELELLKSETRQSIGDLKTAAVSLAVGGAVVFMGVLFLLLGAVYGLSTVLDPWLAATIVGGVVTLVGVLMLASGRGKLEPAAVAPRRTAQALRKDAQMIKGATTR